MNRTIILIIFYFFYLPVQAQDYKFYTPIGDISQNSITAIDQDTKGFMWFGTRYGVNRYDGLEFTSFLKGLESGISSSSITCLLNDGEGHMWVGTAGGGLAVIDIDLLTLDPAYMELLENLKSSSITSIFKDKRANIWIGTEKNGLKLLEPGKREFRHFFAADQTKNALTSNFITGLLEDNQGNLFIGTWGGGICVYNYEKNMITAFQSENTTNLPDDNIIRSMHKGKSGHIWVGTHAGIRKVTKTLSGLPKFEKISIGDKKLSDQLDNSVVLSLIEDANSRLWVGTENEGLFLYDLKNQKEMHFTQDSKNQYSLNSNSIWSLFEDQHGTIWIGTYKNGLSKADPLEQKFQHISDGLESNYNISYSLVSAFAEDAIGNIWIGTDGGGLNCLKRTEKFDIQSIDRTSFPGLASDVIVSMLNDQQNQLWVGTWQDGLFMKPANSDRFQSIAHDPNNLNTPSGNNILELYEAPNGDIWISPFRKGLDLYVPSENQFYHFVPSIQNTSISSSRIKSMVVDKDGYLWLGTEDEGLDRIRLDENHEIVEVRNYTSDLSNASSLSSNSINYLFIDDNNQLWIGTEGSGLNKYNSELDNFVQISTKDGLPGNVIYGILDDDEQLWVSTNAGLASIQRDDRAIQIYDVKDGLQSNEFSESAAFRTKNGMLLFGGNNGFNYFDPKEIRTNKVIPPVYITDVLLNKAATGSELNRKLNHELKSGFIELAFDENDLEFQFAGLSYTQSSKNRYSYFLENYDEKWREIRNENKARYSNVPPGSYTFKVKASNNDGVWNPVPAEIKVDILFPWYKTNLAYLVYTLLTLGLLAITYSILSNRIGLKNQLQYEQLERGRMEELNDIKSRFFANISHEFKTPLTLIISPLKAIEKRLIKVENKNQIKLMLRNAERLLILINQILSLSKLESGTEKLKTAKFDIVNFSQTITSNFKHYAEEQFIKFDVNIPKGAMPIFFEKDKIEKVLINLISNAFKYTPEFGRIGFTLTEEGDYAKISISDTGIGISADQLHLIFNRYFRAKNTNNNVGTGIGLSLSKQLVELHKGIIKVNSIEGQGTTFDVYLRKGRSHLEDDQIYEPDTLHNLSEDSMIELKDFHVNLDKEEVLPDNEASHLPLVLIAEDNPDLRAFTRTYLQMNYQILEAENGQQAFEMAKKHIPDIIITDLMMPKVNGYELAKMVREDERTSHIFLIMLTVKSSDESKEDGFEAGVDYYISKPFNPKLLDLRIQNILKSRNTFKNQILKKNISLTANTSSVSISPKDEEFMNKIINVIDVNLGNSKFGINDICKEIGFSKSQLYRKLKGLVDQSANEFIRSIRLKRAAEMLTQKELTVSQITYKVGFNDLQYFRTCFKNQYGMTPSDYISRVSSAVGK